MKRHFTEDVFLENTGTIQKSSGIQHTAIYWTSLYFHSFELLTKLFFSSVWLISSSNFMYKGNNIHVRKNLWSWKSAASIKLLVPTTKVLEISFYLAMWVGKCPPNIFQWKTLQFRLLCHLKSLYQFLLSVEAYPYSKKLAS